MVLQLVKKFPAFLEPEGSSPYSQVPATCPYPEPTPSIRNLRTRHTVVTGTHLPHGRGQIRIQKSERGSMLQEYFQLSLCHNNWRLVVCACVRTCVCMCVCVRARAWTLRYVGVTCHLILNKIKKKSYDIIRRRKINLNATEANPRGEGLPGCSSPPPPKKNK